MDLLSKELNLNNMKVIYRISDSGYNKVKPNYINNEICLKNALKTFKNANWSIIADNISSETNNMIQNNISRNHILYVEKGNGAATFNLALDEAIAHSDSDEIIYFLENDYLHKPGSLKVIEEGISLGAEYITLYNHPDKFIPPQYGGNPEVDSDGGYSTKLYRGSKNIFYTVNSTTMTFASKVKTLKNDEEILRKWTNGTHPHDFRMFLDLRNQNRTLLCPVESFSTHGESLYLAPLPGVEKNKVEEEWGKISHTIGE